MSRFAVLLVFVVTAWSLPSLAASTVAQAGPAEPMLYAVSRARPPVVSVYDMRGHVVRRFTASGAVPLALAVDDDRHVFLSTASGIRTPSVIGVYDGTGSLVRTITKNVELVLGLAMDAGRIYTSNSFPLQAGPTPIVNYVGIYGSETGAFMRRFDAVMRDPQGIGLDGQGNVYVLNGEEPRGTAPANSVTVFDPSGALVRTIPVLRAPRRLAVSTSGTVFVDGFDTIGENVTAYAPGRAPVLVRRGDPSQRLTVAADPRNNVYVAHSATAVSVYDDRGAFLREITLDAPDPTDASPLLAVR